MTRSVTSSMKKIFDDVRAGYVLYFTPTGVLTGWHPLLVTVSRPEHSKCGTPRLYPLKQFGRDLRQPPRVPLIPVAELDDTCSGNVALLRQLTHERRDVVQ